MPALLSTDVPRSVRIFVVENDADTLEHLQFYLEETGYTVLSARTMSEALEQLPVANCDVLISDLGLPDGTGWDLLSHLQLPHPIYAVAMSGFGAYADQSRSRAAGFRHHLQKPFTLESLDVVLAEAARELQAITPPQQV